MRAACRSPARQVERFRALIRSPAALAFAVAISLDHRSLFRPLPSLRAFFRQPIVRECLLWSLPALLLGLVLRATLLTELPYAIYHNDTHDFLTTTYRLLFRHHLQIHPKKTFLVPLFFTLPALLRIPVLFFVPLVQHALGLVLIAMVGALCRLWFAWWKVFLLPITLLVALDPPMLWFEHTMMAESLFVFCTVLLALAGTLYARQPTWLRLAFLGAALVLEAGARPEGKLLFGFALLLLLLLHARRWRSAWLRWALLLALAGATHFVTKTSQAGLLLYTSVVRLTPPDLKVAPGFDPFIAPVRAKLQKLWEEERLFPHVRDRREVASAVTQYLQQTGQKTHGGHENRVNRFCTQLAAETCRRRFFQLPSYFYYKFRSTAMQSPAGLMDHDWLLDRQASAYSDDSDTTFKLARTLTGQPLLSNDAYKEWLHAHYQEVPWFNALSDSWSNHVNALRMPDAVFGTNLLYGIPFFFLLPPLGVIAMMFRRGRLRLFHIAWGLALLAFFYTIILTASAKPRFRFVFEPFWLIYLGLLLDSLAYWILPRHHRPVDEPGDPLLVAELPVSPAPCGRVSNQ